MAAKNNCGFLSTILYFESQNATEATYFINKYNIQSITVQQWARKRRTIRANIIKVSNYNNSGRNGEKESFLQYFSSGRFDDLCNAEKDRHTLRECKECVEHHREHFLLRRGNSAPQPNLPLPATPNRDNARGFLQKTPDTISKDDITDVFKNYVKPILNHAFKTPHTTHCYDKLLGKRKLPDPKYLSKKAKSMYTKELNEAMREENEGVDFLRVYSGTTSESAWEAQRKKDLIQRKNKTKSHTARLKNYNYDQELLLSKLVDMNGNYEKVNWTKIAREVTLRNSKGEPPKNGGQVSGRIYLFR